MVRRRVEKQESSPLFAFYQLFRIARSNHSLDLYRLISRTAEYGPVRSVVWEGGRREAFSLSRFDDIT